MISLCCCARGLRGGEFSLDVGTVKAVIRLGVRNKSEYYLLDDAYPFILLVRKWHPTYHHNCFLNSPPAPSKSEYSTNYKRTEIKRPLICGGEMEVA